MAQTDFPDQENQENDQAASTDMDLNDNIPQFNTNHTNYEDWCACNENTEFYKFPWYPKELIPEIPNITMSVRNRIPGRDAFTRKLQYRGSFIRIQTPPVKEMFSVKKYSHKTDKGTDLENKLHYSIHLSLKVETEEHQRFKECLEKLDEYALSSYTGLPDKYVSAIRFNHKNKNLPPVLRVKIPHGDGKLLVDIFDDNNHWTETTYEQLSRLIKHETKIECVIQVTGLWKAGESFGISYQAMQIRIIEGANRSLFRND